MFKLVPIFATICLITLCYGCDPCLNMTCNDGIRFKIKDKLNDEDLVLGPTARYRYDSISLIGNANGSYSRISFDSSQGALFSYLENGPDTVFVRLASNLVDTFSIKYIYLSNKCCEKYHKEYGEPITLIYNGMVANKIDGIFIFKR